MIYFCINNGFDSVEKAAAGNFERTSENHWETRKPIDGVRRGFYLFPDTCADVPKYETGAVIRAYEEDVCLMAAGESLDQRVEEMKKNSPNFPIKLEIKAGIAKISTQLPEKMKKAGIETGYASRSWRCTEAGFGRMMAELWVPDPAEAWAAYEVNFDIPSQKSEVVRRKDIEFMIIGKHQLGHGIEPAAVARVVFDPADFDCNGNRIYGRGGGSGPVQYISGANGAYFHPSAIHTGEATAEANGVDLSDFNDDMDGM